MGLGKRMPGRFCRFLLKPHPHPHLDGAGGGTLEAWEGHFPNGQLSNGTRGRKKKEIEEKENHCSFILSRSFIQ